MISLQALERVVKEAAAGKTIPLTRKGKNFSLMRAEEFDEKLTGLLALVKESKGVEKFFKVFPGLEYLIAQRLFEQGFELHPSYWRS
jgi:hypothetical protein